MAWVMNLRGMAFQSPRGDFGFLKRLAGVGEQSDDA